MEKRIVLYMFMGLFIISITACSSVFPTKINTIMSNPRDYADKQGTISGAVKDTFSLVVVKYFVKQGPCL